MASPRGGARGGTKVPAKRAWKPAAAQATKKVKSTEDLQSEGESVPEPSDPPPRDFEAESEERGESQSPEGGESPKAPAPANPEDDISMNIDIADPLTWDLTDPSVHLLRFPVERWVAPDILKEFIRRNTARLAHAAREKLEATDLEFGADGMITWGGRHSELEDALIGLNVAFVAERSLVPTEQEDEEFKDRGPLVFRIIENRVLDPFAQPVPPVLYVRPKMRQAIARHIQSIPLKPTYPAWERLRLMLMASNIPVESFEVEVRILELGLVPVIERMHGLVKVYQEPIPD